MDKKRATRSIALVLIGTPAFVTGCGRGPTTSYNSQGTPQPYRSGSGYHSGHYYGSGTGVGGTTSSSSSTTRGGFGAIGRAFSGFGHSFGG